MGKLAPEAGGDGPPWCCWVRCVPLQAGGQTPWGKNIPVSDAQKHVFKAPVYNVHLYIMIIFKSSLNGIAVL